MHLLAERFVCGGWWTGFYERGSQDFSGTNVEFFFLLTSIWHMLFIYFANQPTFWFSCLTKCPPGWANCCSWHYLRVAIGSASPARPRIESWEIRWPGILTFLSRPKLVLIFAAVFIPPSPLSGCHVVRVFGIHPLLHIQYIQFILLFYPGMRQRVTWRFVTRILHRRGPPRKCQAFHFYLLFFSASIVLGVNISRK